MGEGGLLTGQARWGVPGDWSEGAIPIANSKAIMPASLGNDVTDAGADAEGIDLDLLLTHAGFVKSFGASGSPIRTAADFVHVMGAGPFFFEADGAALTTDEIRIEAANAGTPVEIGSNAADKGSILQVHISRGSVQISGSAKFSGTAQVVLSSMGGAADASLRISHGADTTLAEFIQTAGKSFIDNIVTRLTVANGTCTKAQQKAGIIDVYRGGVLIYDHAAVAAEVTMCRVHTGGMLDLNRNSLLKVLDLVIVFRGGKLRKNDGLHTITDLRLLDVEG